jgi:plasmid stabilization system protein ParE
MIISIHPLAEAELVDAASYHTKEANAALGEAFVAEFAHSIELIRAHPQLGALWRGTFRRLPLRRFPYSIIYHELPTALHVIALAHQSRRPGYWHGRS